MEQLRKLIRKTLLEERLSKLSENLYKVTPSADDKWGKTTKEAGEQWAASMMEKGKESSITLKDDMSKKLKTIAYAVELLIDAYRKGTGEYLFPTINKSVVINKQNIIDSIQNAFSGITDETLRVFLLNLTGQFWSNEVWYSLDVEAVRKRPFTGNISNSGAKSDFANYKGMENLSKEEIKNLSIPRMEYLIETYINKEVDKSDSTFLTFLAIRVNNSIKKVLSERAKNKEIAAKLGTQSNVPKVTSFDKPFGEKGQTFAGTYMAGTTRQPDFELPQHKKMTEEEKFAALDLINKKVYELIKKTKPAHAELFKLRVIGEDENDNHAKTTKSNKEIAQMFIDGDKLSAETTEFIKAYLMRALKKDPQEYTPQLAGENKKIILQKIKDTFGTLKASIAESPAVYNHVAEIISNAYATSIENGKERVPSYVAKIFGEKTGEKGIVSKKTAKEKREGRRLKALVTFLVRKKEKIKKYLNAIKDITPNTLKDFFTNDTYFEKLVSAYPEIKNKDGEIIEPEFAESLIELMKENGLIKQKMSGKDVDDWYKQNAHLLADIGNIDEPIRDLVTQADNDLYENISEGQVGGDDDFKFDSRKFKELADELTPSDNLSEARKIIRKIILSEFLKKL